MQLFEIMDKLDTIIEYLDGLDDIKKISDYVDDLRDISSELLDFYQKHKTLFRRDIFKRKTYDSH